jgi:hypothetical protein
MFPTGIHCIWCFTIRVSGETYIEPGVPYNVTCTVSDFLENRRTNTKHLLGTVGIHGALLNKDPSLFFDVHLNVTDEDKSVCVLYVQCVANPSISQEHTLL